VQAVEKNGLVREGKTNCCGVVIVRDNDWWRGLVVLAFCTSMRSSED